MKLEIILKKVLGFSVVNSASTIASFIFYTLLSQTFEDKVLGLYNIILTTIGLISIISYLGLEKRIQISTFDSKNSNNIIFIFLFNYVFLFLIFLLINQKLRIIDNNSIQIPLFLIGFIEIVRIYLSKINIANKRIGLTYISNLINNLVKIIMINLNFNIYGLFYLLIIVCFSSLVETFILFFSKVKFILGRLNFNFFKSNKNDIVFNFPNRLLNFFNQNILTFLMTPIFGIEVLGIFFISKKIVEMPLNFINSVLSDLYLSRISEKRNTFSTSILFILISISFYVLIALVFLIINVKSILMLLPKWNSYYPIVISLFPFIIVRQLSSLVSQYYFKNRATQILLYFNIVYLSLVFLLTLSSKYFLLSFDSFITYFSLISSLTYGSFLIITLKDIYAEQTIL